MRAKWIAILSFAIVLCACAAFAQAPSDVVYQKPPREILQLVDVDLPPDAHIDPTSRFLLLLRRPTFRSLEELGQPELRLAGLRLNPQNGDNSRPNYYLGVSLVEIQTGRAIAASGLPDPIQIEYAGFSPKGRYVGLVQAEPAGLSEWVIEIATGKATRLTDRVLSGAFGTPCAWSPDEGSMYCRVRANRDPLPAWNELPSGPVVQETTGQKAPGATWQDLLKNKNDERRFDYLATSTIQRFSLAGSSEPLLPAAVYSGLQVSSDGNWLLIEEIQHPYSYQFPFYRFPYTTFVVDKTGEQKVELVKKPLRDSIPIDQDATETGRRDFTWRDDVPATVVWAEAQDEGDPSREAAFRDFVYQLDAPFGGSPRLFCATRNRLESVTWGEGATAIVRDYLWKTRNVKVYRVDPGKENRDPKPVFDYSSEDLYHLPGVFVTAPNSYGRPTLLFSKDRKKIYLASEGYSPEGNRPFFDEYDLTSGKTNRLWRADGVSTYEKIIDVVDLQKKQLLTRIESTSVNPNYFLRTIGSKKAPMAITNFPNPYKSFEGTTKQKIHYKRDDGVDLSADLYLPKGYDPKKDGRLPLLMEAYPIEFKDPAAAGMLDSSPHQFVSLYWSSPVFWAVRGYAVLEGAQFPIVGKGKEEPNDTYVEQLVADARAAIKAVDDMGVADPKRAAVMGHSYGAFMVVNLLAHSDLFAAGIARSGAYNRSLTPFGFQSEERNYWQAQSTYLKMSPFNYADKIKGWLLMIHGDADNNSGTFTLQSERLFQALKGLGGHARLVLLPYESHSYRAKENILHMLWEEDTWLETHVKNAR